MPKIWQREWWFPRSKYDKPEFKNLPWAREMLETWERNEREERRRHRRITLGQWKEFLIACVSAAAIGLVTPNILGSPTSLDTIVTRWVAMCLISCGWVSYTLLRQLEDYWWTNREKGPPSDMPAQYAISVAFGGMAYLGFAWLLSWPLFVIGKLLGIHLYPM